MYAGFDYIRCMHTWIDWAFFFSLLNCSNNCFNFLSLWEQNFVLLFPSSREFFLSVSWFFSADIPLIEFNDCQFPFPHSPFFPFPHFSCQSHDSCWFINFLHYLFYRSINRDFPFWEPVVEISLQDNSSITSLLWVIWICSIQCNFLIPLGFIIFAFHLESPTSSFHMQKDP